MSIEITWQQIAIRLALACAAGLLLGYNRDEHGRPAGMRTVMLVTLTATLAMLQVNLLLPLRGKPLDSFVVMDLMRLPLGILSGIGFIGAGAIIKKESGAIGVTTAATLWFATMLGLLFGGGQTILGCVATALALLILTFLRTVEAWVPRARRGTITLLFGDASPGEPTVDEAHIVTQIRSFSPQLHGLAIEYTPEARIKSLRCGVKWQASARHLPATPPRIAVLRQLPGLTCFQWTQED